MDGECLLCNIDPLHIRPLHTFEHSMQWINSIVRYSRFNDIRRKSGEKIYKIQICSCIFLSFNSAEIPALMQKLLWTAWFLVWIFFLLLLLFPRHFKVVVDGCWFLFLIFFFCNFPGNESTFGWKDDVMCDRTDCKMN